MRVNCAASLKEPTGNYVISELEVPPQTIFCVLNAFWSVLVSFSTFSPRPLGTGAGFAQSWALMSADIQVQQMWSMFAADDLKK